MITTTKQTSENIRATSLKRGKDNILNKLLANSQKFHYSSLSFASAGPALDLSNHREMVWFKQVTWADAQKTGTCSKTSKCSPLVTSYSEALRAQTGLHDNSVQPPLWKTGQRRDRTWAAPHQHWSNCWFLASLSQHAGLWLRTEKCSLAHHFWHIARPNSPSL